LAYSCGDICGKANPDNVASSVVCGQAAGVGGLGGACGCDCKNIKTSEIVKVDCFPYLRTETKKKKLQEYTTIEGEPIYTGACGAWNLGGRFDQDWYTYESSATDLGEALKEAEVDCKVKLQAKILNEQKPVCDPPICPLEEGQTEPEDCKPSRQPGDFVGIGFTTGDREVIRDRSRNIIGWKIRVICSVTGPQGVCYCEKKPPPETTTPSPAPPGPPPPPTYPTYPGCGDGVAQPELGEECDGDDLRGFSCQSFGFSSGQLSCSFSCTFDTSGCRTTYPGGGGGTYP
jgi:hypothetical protein